MRPKISLVMATLGRFDEVSIFIDSLTAQTVPHDIFELIIVDQNSCNTIFEIIQKKSLGFKILHVKSNVKGLSANRNIGITKCQGEIIAFPDDDCVYYPDTLSSVLTELSRSECDCILGRIYNRSNNMNVIKNWPLFAYRVRIIKLHSVCSSITIFSKVTNLFFDERLGAGAFYGGSEDLDYLWMIIDMGYRVVYTPAIEVSHPPQSSDCFSSHKLNSYMRGFGAVLKKHASVHSIILFILALFYYISCFALNLLKTEFSTASKRLKATCYFLQAFYRFKV